MSGLPTYNRREMLRLSTVVAGAAMFGVRTSEAQAAATGSAPSAPVALGRCGSYDPALVRQSLSGLLDKIGGVRSLVKGKTVTLKVNGTGGSARCLGLPPAETYHTHPVVVQAVVELLDAAGAKRIRLVESAPERVSLEEYLTRCGWNVPSLRKAGANVEFENTRNLGTNKDYATLKVPGGGLLYPAYLVNRAYEDTDVFISLAKLKAHTTAGVTVGMKNLFGITPNSLYGDDAGHEDAVESRGNILHGGWQAPPAGVPRQLAALKNQAEDRVPRIIVDLVRARPIDLVIVDGITSVAGGEGPWTDGLRMMKPGVLLAGRNPVCTDAVAAAVMGYDPEAKSQQGPFPGDNMFTLAAEAGLGTPKLEKIDVRGLTLAQAKCPYGRVNFS